MIILLDIDRVLELTPPWRRVEIAADGFMKLDEDALKNLYILYQQTNASVVLTTTHRLNYDEATWKEIFKSRGVPFESITKINNKTDIHQIGERVAEITEWVENQGVGKNFVIIDDDSSLHSLPQKIKERWVATTPSLGFNKEALEQALGILTHFS